MRTGRLRRWCLGVLAVWASSAVGNGFEVDPPERPVTREERSHWAYAPPVKPKTPKVQGRDWVRNPIDAFLLSAMEADGIRPAAEADRPTLLRRLTFDLTGLPSTPAELDAFLADKAAGAYEKVVDRLLASPRYGERWAQHWLDLARYADSDGFEFDQTRPDAWRYRDWVVAALNADMPYDRFVRLQLAGDEVEPQNPGATVATGFNRCYPDMVDLNDQGLRRQNALNDITETTGLVFLGLTIGCARCHDHKFDAIRQTDFFQLEAFFTPARFRDDLPVASPARRASYEEARAAWTRRVTELARVIVRIESPVRDRLTPGRPPGVDDESAAALAKDPSARSERELELSLDAWRKDRRFRPELWPLVLDPTTNAARLALRSRLDRVKADEPARLPLARGVDEAGPAAPPTFLLLRGDYANKGPRVEPAVPLVLRDGSRESPPIRPRARSTGRRAALADWLTRPDHPLTARVIVNRLWQHHFGRGIVATTSDFGVMGGEPSHPELLDWLATELVAERWSLKAVHRLMVTSAAYRQSCVARPGVTEADPDNERLSRFRRTRLEGEAIRDALLAVSGELSPVMGGPAVFPELPLELTKLSSKGAVWPVSKTAEERARRSLYVFVRRNLRYPFFEAFDRPDTNASCPQRPSSTIAPQALTLMNSRLAADAAGGLAARVRREAGAGVDDQVRHAFRLALGREPVGGEREDARAFLARDHSLAHFCLALINANEFVYID